MKQDLFSFSFSFLNTYNFPIFRNCRRKTVWVVLIFDKFQYSNSFLSFLRVSDLSESAEISVFLSLTSVQKLCSTLFTGDFPRSQLNSACLSNADFCPKLKILLQISLTGNGLLAWRVCGPIIRLFLLSLPCQVTLLEWPRLLPLFSRLQVTECG